VYAQEINPLNQVPLNLNQLPHPSQKVPLSTEREPSTIPKGGTDSATWSYPSPQMFYNALKRKGKGDDVDEAIVTEIVGIHNNMNEKTWRRVLAWESLRRADCDEAPRLSRFTGRPDELSPRAWLAHHVLGRDRPFDRHDWFVTRCGRERRYVIDYYHDESKGKEDRTPQSKHDWTAMKSISLVTRPAVDSPSALLDRMRMPVYEALGWASPDAFNHVAPTAAAAAAGRGAAEAAGASCPVDAKAAPQPPPECPMHSASSAKPASAPAPAPANVDLAALDGPKLLEVSEHIQGRCKAAFEALQRCASVSAGDEETALQCERAGFALFHCIATVVCPVEAAACAARPSDEAALDGMMRCVRQFEAKAGEIRER